MGYELIHAHRATIESLAAADVEALGEGMGSWGDVDTFGGYIAGPAWLRGQISNAVVARWTRSPDRWWRRAALVATVSLNKKSGGGTGDPGRTLEVCTRLADDHDDMVEKALSWALRMLVRWDAQSVADFLQFHEDVLAARVKREVTNKLGTGLKNPRKGGRSS
jgi:3-methyladenine DNA glycosylase AlkD